MVGHFLRLIDRQAQSRAVARFHDLIALAIIAPLIAGRMSSALVVEKQSRAREKAAGLSAWPRPSCESPGRLEGSLCPPGAHTFLRGSTRNGCWAAVVWQAEPACSVGCPCGAADGEDDDNK